MMSTLSTTQDTIEVTTRSVDTLDVNFAAQINEGESIVSATATLLRTTAVSGGSAVTGFVTSTPSVDTTVVSVPWTGEVLAVGGVYVLVVAATLDTGAIVVTLTEIRCVA
jgi:hypothetical protein